MERRDAATMEQEGLFFLSLALVPQAWYESQRKPVTVEYEDYRNLPTIWWRFQTVPISVTEYCDAALTRGDPLGYYLSDDFYETAWTDQNNHGIELTQNETEDVLELNVQIDVREPFSEFLDFAIRFTLDARCLFYEYAGGVFFEPDRRRIIQEISRHELTHATFNSSGYITHH